MSKIRQLKMIWYAVRMETDDQLEINLVLYGAAWGLFNQWLGQVKWDWTYFFRE